MRKNRKCTGAVRLRHRSVLRSAPVLASLLCLALLCGCAGAPPAVEAEQTAAQGSPAAERGADAPVDWSDYAPFGLDWDKEADTLTYEGRRVRWFQDYWPVDGDPCGQSWAGIDHLDEAGVVDVHGVRDLSAGEIRPDGSYDPSGVLTGLALFSQEAFDARDLEALKHPQVADVSAGAPEELAALYAAYAPFGLTYDAEGDCLRFNGEKVRFFRDVLAANGEAPAGGRFHGCLRQTWNDGGTVDVRAVRDYDAPDADGYGALLGVEACSQAEFDARIP